MRKPRTRALAAALLGSVRPIFAAAGISGSAAGRTPSQ
ncbi:hypothetical protein ABIA33_004888 [Streptacidiphilus sp. MAP12-16]